MLFDTHAHYDDDQFDPDREALLASLPERGVGLVVNPGCTWRPPDGGGAGPSFPPYLRCRGHPSGKTAAISARST